MCLSITTYPPKANSYVFRISWTSSTDSLATSAELIADARALKLSVPALQLFRHLHHGHVQLSFRAVRYEFFAKGNITLSLVIVLLSLCRGTAIPRQMDEQFSKRLQLVCPRAKEPSDRHTVLSTER